MERIHMNYINDIIHRLRCGESEKQISRDLGISRPTVHKYKIIATMEGYLDIDTGRPGLEQLAEVLGPKPQPPKKPSTLEPYPQVLFRICMRLSLNDMSRVQSL